MPPSVPRVSCQGVYKFYQEGEQQTVVLNNVALTLASAEKVAIIGSSGSGKSTLLHILSGLDQPSRGQVSICGQTLQGMSSNALARLRNQQVGMIYQFHHLLPEFTAVENVAMPLLISGMRNSVAVARAMELLARVGLSERAQHYPSMLSGGERQRVAIARALINQPSVVFADEPTGNLDQRNGQHIYELFHQVTTDLATTVLMVTHDINMAQQMDRVLTLRDGSLHEFQPVEPLR